MVTNHKHGGYDMDDNEIGTALMVAAVCEFLWQVRWLTVCCITILLYVFVSLIQLFAFPWISKCLGYRRTFHLGLLLFAATTVVLPFSNQITGPIPEPPGSNSTSGSGSGSGFENSTDYCGNNLSAELSVNVNSVKRIPLYVWAFVTAILGIQVMNRYAVNLPLWIFCICTITNTHTHTYTPHTILWVVSDHLDTQQQWHHHHTASLLTCTEPQPLTDTVNSRSSTALSHPLSPSLRSVHSPSHHSTMCRNTGHHQQTLNIQAGKLEVGDERKERIIPSG